VDDRTAYFELLSRARSRNPDITWKISHFSEPYALFSFYGVKNEIQNLGARKIWLKCGAYIVIDRTEALTAVDVNTGRFMGARSPGDTVLRVNLEAVVETARQLRLRDIGGIILVDLLRMDGKAQYDEVIATLEEEFQKDPRKCYVAGVTRLGLLELTRQNNGGASNEAPGAPRERDGGYDDDDENADDSVSDGS